MSLKRRYQTHQTGPSIVKSCVVNAAKTEAHLFRTRCLVGVIGGDDSVQSEAARQFGAEIVRAGQILLTGGTPVNTNEVKNAAMWGAMQAEERSAGEEPVRARMIGILNSQTEDWDTSHPCRLYLRTGLTSYERDAINGLTPDVLIVFRGGRGTLCELAYAAAACKPLRYYDSVEALRDKTQEHIADGALAPVLEEALRKYPVVLGREVSSQDLLRALCGALDGAKSEDFDPKRTIHQVVDDVFKHGPRLGPTGFPGLNGEKRRFESLVESIGKCGSDR